MGLYNDAVDEVCLNGSLFVQYNCIQSEASQESKYEKMCIVVSSAVLIAFLFTIVIRWLYQGGIIK